MRNKMLENRNEIILEGKGTIVILLINSVVFIALNIVPRLEETLLLSHQIPLIIEKLWTLITVFFSHQVLIHIVLNMGLLVYFGFSLERLTSAKSVAVIYFIAGLMGSLSFPLTGLIINGTGLIAGASAAVMGVVAAYSVLRPNVLILKSKAKWWTVALVAFSVVSAILLPDTLDSDIAHLAGILVGVISGFYIKKRIVS
ncbi:rhomboid family intramembrane serine protease [Alkalibacterium sp.]|nr:MAG: rhomboid family intramembrane serine protease [Alkalibacterium sp.]